MTSNLLNRFETLKEWLNGRVIGQQSLVNRLLLALLCGGHLIVEGAPGLAKTRVIKELAKGIEGDFHRIQFTPDLLPSDVTGTEIFRMEEGSFHFQSKKNIGTLRLTEFLHPFVDEEYPIRINLKKMTNLFLKTKKMIKV